METGVQSWSGDGVGTGRESFLAKIREQFSEAPAEELAEAVLCTLQTRLSGATAERLFEQLTPDTRDLASTCRHPGKPAKALNRDDFYLEVSNHLGIEPERTRLVLHVVFAALHSQITERLSDSIASELPDTLANTWLAARKGVQAPR